MRKLITASIVSIFCVVAVSAMAQEQTPIHRDTKHSVFGGPALKVTQFYDDVEVMIGGQSGWIINNTLSIGAGVYGQINDNFDAPVPDRHLNVGYLGGIVGFIILSDRPIQLFVNTLIGGGGVNRPNWGAEDWYWDSWDDRADGFFVAEPGVDLILNVTKSFRIGIGGSYRYVNGIDLEGLSNSDISGLSATVTFGFGKF